ncbi:AtpZ/AtpI family protein [Roseovarius salinarum]|uniref:AtpZ/AtpI family protein n=1 Tax=Roseovarius salinarum TaxID=1981892 RepID=UPI000C346609|nr:AtpZ/AtpI family protein [Roseovarius salinarum]
MTDPEDDDRLARLDERIAAAKAQHATAGKAHQEEHYSQAQLAWRMVIELVAGLLIGFGMGYGLDSLLGTLPVFLVLFTFLGFAAGIKTMMRSAQEIQKQQEAATAAEEDAPGDGEDERARNGD